MGLKLITGVARGHRRVGAGDHARCRHPAPRAAGRRRAADRPVLACTGAARASPRMPAWPAGGAGRSNGTRGPGPRPPRPCSWCSACPCSTCGSASPTPAPGPRPTPPARPTTSSPRASDPAPTAPWSSSPRATGGDTEQALTALSEQLRETPGVAQASPPVIERAGGTLGVVQVVPTTGPQRRGDDRARAAPARRRGARGSGRRRRRGCRRRVHRRRRGLRRLQRRPAAGLPRRRARVLDAPAARGVPRRWPCALKAVVVNLLSIGAAFGVIVAVFQWGWGVRPARRRGERTDRGLGPDDAHRHRLRAVDGLRGVPAVEDQGGVRRRAATTRPRSPRAWLAPPG